MTALLWTMDNLLGLMSVEPGFGGQKYIKSTYDKIIFAKNIFPKIDVSQVLSAVVAIVSIAVILIQRKRCTAKKTV